MNWKLLLVDPHPMLRKGVRHELSRLPDVSRIEEATNGAFALKVALGLKPDLVLMEIHLPDQSGLDVTRGLATTLPTIKVVIFSSARDRTLVDEALQAGACGYISKSAEPKELLEGIGMAMAGKLYVSPEISAGILEDYRKRLVETSGPVKPFLSARDQELLRRVAAGRRNKEIAADLGLSIKSVEAYRSRLMKKLECSSSAEMVRYAVRNGIVPA